MKAVILDLDGTLLHTDKTLSEYTLGVMQKCHDSYGNNEWSEGHSPEYGTGKWHSPTKWNTDFVQNYRNTGCAHFN